jgi:hypothetical protein
MKPGQVSNNKAALLQHGAEHIPQEHEGEQQSHIRLEFDRREIPGHDTGRQREAGEDHHFASE